MGEAQLQALVDAVRRGEKTEITQGRSGAALTQEIQQMLVEVLKTIQSRNCVFFQQEGQQR